MGLFAVFLRHGGAAILGHTQTVLIGGVVKRMLKSVAVTARRVIIVVWALLYRLLDRVVPKEDNLVAFSQDRRRYSDNGRALYEYMSSNPSWRAVWLADGTDVRDRINLCSPGFEVTLRGSPSAFWVSLRASHAVITHGLGDLGPYRYKSGSTCLVQLWHAITVKSYGVLDNRLGGRQVREYLSKETLHYDLVIASSEMDRCVTAACTGVNARRIVVTGLPRNDRLCDWRATSGLTTLDRSLQRIVRESNVILYAPTFRDVGLTEFFPFDDFDLGQLVEFLQEQNAVILVRPHQNDFRNQEIVDSLAAGATDRIILAGNLRVPDATVLLPYVDVVVTDYSSIYVDALLCDIPPVFVPYDLEAYQQSRGLAYPYESVTPGPKALSQAEFLQALEASLGGAPDYAEHRQLVKRMFHKYSDAKACERVASAMRRMMCCD